MGEDCLSCLTCVLSFCLFEQYNMFKVNDGKQSLMNTNREHCFQ